ncbi:Oxygen-independent coproporphyrinogen-III oxidase-like protein YqeR [bioreactor metagenome]|uniref:Oxygen-independent coproporphyrinogen-III oxidase-like protein YqeR n=1 Tax=bioreactor metagenome TaxID=1076179 RepID=A0A644Y7F9_9ZZZZ
MQAWKTYSNAYGRRLMEEISQCTGSERVYDTIFVGGGNPGSLTPEQLASLLRSAQKHGKSREVTIEMNPETFGEHFFPLFSDGLVNRMSMGIQSMDDQLLKRLGRNASRSDNLRAITLANSARKRYGIELNFDLMVCLPGQTLQMAINDIHEVLSLADAHHISLYCLTVEEGTELARAVGMQELAVLDEDGQAEMLKGIWGELSLLGFSHYEVSNFCKHEKFCEHNLRYWNISPFLGLGSSAASTLIGKEGWYHYTQTQDLRQFSSSALFSGYEREDLSLVQSVEEYLMMALRTKWGIEKQLLENRYGLAFDKTFSSLLGTLDSSWYFDTAQNFSLSEIGFLLLDEILLRFVMQIPEPLDRPNPL